MHCKHSVKNTTLFFMYILHLRNNALYFLKHKPNFFRKELVLIYCSSDSSSEENSLKSCLICLITFFFNLFTLF